MRDDISTTDTHSLTEGPRCNMHAAPCRRSGHLCPRKRAGENVRGPDDPRAVHLSVQRLTLSLITTAVMERYHWWLHTDGRLPRSTWPVSYGGDRGLDWRRRRAEVWEPCRCWLCEMGHSPLNLSQKRNEKAPVDQLRPRARFRGPSKGWPCQYLGLACLGRSATARRWFTYRLP